MAKGPTVPQIVVNDLAIGGFVDLVQYFESQNI
jgi:glutaredoxin